MIGRRGARASRRPRPGLAVVAITIALAALAIDPSGAAPPPAAFDHAAHREQAKGLGVAVERCETCHVLDRNQKLVPVASRGHAPCLDSRCHLAQFIARPGAGDRRPESFVARRAGFCGGCHAGVPRPWERPATVAPSPTTGPQHHVELNHYRHTQQPVPPGAAAIACATCHVVDPTTLALNARAPGHAQCALCHDADDGTKRSMAACGQCHREGSPATYFDGSRPATTVRACGSEGLTATEARFAAPASQRLPGGAIKARCFKHERVEHRFRDAAHTIPLPCDACHTTIADPVLGPRQFATPKDLRSRSIIGASRDQQHRACGASGCHQRDVGGQGFAPKCGLCHPDVSGF